MGNFKCSGLYLINCYGSVKFSHFVRNGECWGAEGAEGALAFPRPVRPALLACDALSCPTLSFLSCPYLPIALFCPIPPCPNLSCPVPPCPVFRPCFAMFPAPSRPAYSCIARPCRQTAASQVMASLLNACPSITALGQDFLQTWKKTRAA